MVSAEEIARFLLARDAPPPSPQTDRAAVEAWRRRKALVERLYAERGAHAEAVAIAALVDGDYPKMNQSGAMTPANRSRSDDITT
jgi:hypothetical protein